MAETFRKLVANQYTRDFRSAGEVIEVPVVAPVAGEILVKNHFGGVNASDVNISGGVYFSDGTFPFDLGCESIGEVVAIGEGVSDFKVGDSVVSPELGSAYSEMLCRDVSQFVKVPGRTPEIMGVIVNGVTASMGLNIVGEMSAGETVLITAAAGGVGSWCVQLAKLAGNHVIGTCSTQEKAMELKRLGCDRVIVYREENIGEVLAAEYPNGVNLVFEQVGRGYIRSLPRQYSRARPHSHLRFHFGIHQRPARRDGTAGLSQASMEIGADQSVPLFSLA